MFGIGSVFAKISFPECLLTCLHPDEINPDKVVVSVMLPVAVSSSEANVNTDMTMEADLSYEELGQKKGNMSARPTEL